MVIQFGDINKITLLIGAYNDNYYEKSALCHYLSLHTMPGKRRLNFWRLFEEGVGDCQVWCLVTGCTAILRGWIQER